MGCPSPGEGRPPSPAHLNVVEGYARWVKGGLGQSPGLGPAWEGGLNGPESGGR